MVYHHRPPLDINILNGIFIAPQNQCDLARSSRPFEFTPLIMLLVCMYLYMHIILPRRLQYRCLLCPCGQGSLGQYFSSYIQPVFCNLLELSNSSWLESLGIVSACCATLRLSAQMCILDTDHVIGLVTAVSSPLHIPMTSALYAAQKNPFLALSFYFHCSTKDVPASMVLPVLSVF